jgi:acetoin utilization deacetylase AcuC-like enzyme
VRVILVRAERPLTRRHSKITKAGFAEMGARVARLALPTLIVMEGGYSAPETLAELFDRFLASFAATSHGLAGDGSH